VYLRIELAESGAEEFLVLETLVVSVCGDSVCSLVWKLSQVNTTTVEKQVAGEVLCVSMEWQVLLWLWGGGGGGQGC
jgi:hypothetical protein